MGRRPDEETSHAGWALEQGGRLEGCYSGGVREPHVYLCGQHSLSATNLESPSSTSLNEDTYIWRGEGKETVCCCS